MRNHRSPGFTLVELLIVVVIVGITTAMGITSFQRSWERERVLALSNELLGWLESARRSAIGGSSCTVEINTGTLPISATVVSVASSSTGHCASIQPLILEGLTSNYQMGVEATVTPITFTSRGTVSTQSGTGDRSITLTLNPGGYSLCIAINNLLGSMAIGRHEGTRCDTTRGR